MDQEETSLPVEGREPRLGRGLHRRGIFVVLPVIVLLCVGFWSLQRSAPRVYVESDTGVYDLTGVDLGSTMAELRRTVEYIPGELLTPEEFTARDDVQMGKIPDGTRVATMRARVLVPEGKLYGFCGYAANYACRIYVNGKWLDDEGTMGGASRRNNPLSPSTSSPPSRRTGPLRS